MASNFHIFSLETRDTLHLKLAGDFDGNSAHELDRYVNKAWRELLSDLY